MMKRSIQVEHEGVQITVIVEDPMDGREWEEREIYVEGDAMQLFDSFSMKYGGPSTYYAIMDKVCKGIKEARKG